MSSIFYESRLDQILGRQGSKAKDVYESKLSLASRIVKTERQVDDLDEKLDRLLGMYEDDRKKMQEQQQQIVVAAAAAAGQAVANHAALSNSGSQLNTPTLNCPPCSPAPTSSPSPPYVAAAHAAAAAAMAVPPPPANTACQITGYHPLMC